MLRVVITEAELEALPSHSIVLITDGTAHYRTRGKWCWHHEGDIPRTSALLADGRPIIVLWDPSAPEVLVSAWVSAMNTIAPYKLEGPVIDVVYRELAEPGANVFFELLSADREAELEALATVDFMNCWAKRVS